MSLLMIMLNVLSETSSYCRLLRSFCTVVSVSSCFVVLCTVVLRGCVVASSYKEKNKEKEKEFFGKFSLFL